jgi:hypothetical protein
LSGGGKVGSVLPLVKFWPTFLSTWQFLIGYVAHEKMKFFWMMGDCAGFVYHGMVKPIPIMSGKVP